MIKLALNWLTAQVEDLPAPFNFNTNGPLLDLKVSFWCFYQSYLELTTLQPWMERPTFTIITDRKASISQAVTKNNCSKFVGRQNRNRKYYLNVSKFNQLPKAMNCYKIGFAFVSEGSHAGL